MSVYDVPVTAWIATDPGLAKLMAVSVLAFAVLAAGLVGRFVNRDHHTSDQPDDLMALHDAVFDGDDVIRAVNEERPSRWAGLDVTSPGSGAWLDYVSRERVQNLGPWLTRAQQDEAGQRFVSYAEGLLKEAAATPEEARQARQQAAQLGETTVEIRRGDPGE